MNNEELIEHNKTRKIYQIAVLTRDIYRTMDAWIENLKIGPWTVLTFTEKTVKDLYVGGELVTEPFKFLIAITTVGDMEFEIIQPVYGPTIYDAFLDSRGEGLHHIKEKVSDEDLPGVLDEYASKGIPVMQTGQFDVDFHYYLDSAAKVDFIYELGNCPVYDLPADMYEIYPAPGN